MGDAASISIPSPPTDVTIKWSTGLKSASRGKCDGKVSINAWLEIKTKTSVPGGKFIPTTSTLLIQKFVSPFKYDTEAFGFGEDLDCCGSPGVTTRGKPQKFGSFTVDTMEAILEPACEDVGIATDCIHGKVTFRWSIFSVSVPLDGTVDLPLGFNPIKLGGKTGVGKIHKIAIPWQLCISGGVMSFTESHLNPTTSTESERVEWSDAKAVEKGMKGKPATHKHGEPTGG